MSVTKPLFGENVTSTELDVWLRVPAVSMPVKIRGLVLLPGVVWLMISVNTVAGMVTLTPGLFTVATKVPKFALVLAPVEVAWSLASKSKVMVAMSPRPSLKLTKSETDVAVPPVKSPVVLQTPWWRSRRRPRARVRKAVESNLHFPPGTVLLVLDPEFTVRYFGTGVKSKFRTKFIFKQRVLFQLQDPA